MNKKEKMGEDLKVEILKIHQKITDIQTKSSKDQTIQNEISKVQKNIMEKFQAKQSELESRFKCL